MNLFEYSPKQAFDGLFSFSFLEKKPEPPKETTQDRLEDHCRHIAESITNELKDCDPDEFNRWHEEGEPKDFTPSGWDYLDDIYDIEYIIDVIGGGIRHNGIMSIISDWMTPAKNSINAVDN